MVVFSEGVRNFLEIIIPNYKNPVMSPAVTHAKYMTSAASDPLLVILCQSKAQIDTQHILRCHCLLGLWSVVLS